VSTRSIPRGKKDRCEVGDHPVDVGSSRLRPDRSKTPPACHGNDLRLQEISRTRRTSRSFRVCQPIGRSVPQSHSSLGEVCHDAEVFACAVVLLVSPPFPQCRRVAPRYGQHQELRAEAVIKLPGSQKVQRFDISWVDHPSQTTISLIGLTSRSTSSMRGPIPSSRRWPAATLSAHGEQ